jgi:hypothetical protein
MLFKMPNKFLEKIAQTKSTYDKVSKPAAEGAVKGGLIGAGVGFAAGHGMGVFAKNLIKQKSEANHKFETAILERGNGFEDAYGNPMTRERINNKHTIVKAFGEKQPHIARGLLAKGLGTAGALYGAARAVKQSLKKEAEDKDFRPAVYGAAGAGLAYHSPGHLLGYTKVYHGTNSTAADQIHQHGLDPSKGGTGASTMKGAYMEESKGKIHVTRNKEYAGAYANVAEKTKGGKAHVITARVPKAQWERMERDTDGGPTKNFAATTTEKIDPEFVSKKPFSGLKPHLNRDSILKHIKSNPKSFAKGVGRLGAGAALIGAGIHQAIKNND